jgi:hypothetical protein
MPGGSDPRGRSFDQVTAGKAAVAVGVFLIVAAILGPSASIGPTATPGHTATPGSTEVATLPTTAPSAAPEAWADLEVGPYAPTAELVADDRDRIGIATTTSFTLRSLTSTPAVRLAAGLQVDPPTKLVVEAGPTADIARVRTKAPLAAGQHYRVRLESPDGALAGNWAFTTRAPLHLVATLPGNLAVQVPVNTGIEVTFDQDGVTGVADHFTITPPVTGRFEGHGRTWAFIPDKPLAPGAIYTVAVSKGVGLSGASETLETGTSVRFETDPGSLTESRIDFGRSMVEVRPNAYPEVTVNAGGGDESSTSTTAHVQIHRLADFKAVIAAATALAGADGWALAARSATVSTAGLTKVADLDVKIVETDAGPLMTIPVRLAKGGYVVTIRQPGPPAQLLVQVTDLSAYALAATRTTIAWVNDLAGDTPVDGATVAFIGGPSLGTTGADGVVRAPTPTLPAPAPTSGDDNGTPAPQFVKITTTGLGSLLVPLGLPVPFGYTGSDWWSGAGADPWWLLFRTDRSLYRQTDTVHVYGTIRARSDRSVPDHLALVLRPVDGTPDAPIVRIPVDADFRGVFSAAIKLDALPIASYNVDLFAGKVFVTSVWITVGAIAKPAYQLDVLADRHVYLSGDKATISATASFFDGTVVPGLDLGFSGLDEDTTATTDNLGKASIDLTVRAGGQPIGWSEVQVDAAAVHPEEGQIGGTAYFIVVPSRVRITADGTITGGTVVVNGRLTWFDIKGLEAAQAQGRSLDDPSGAAIAGGTIKAEILHVVELRTQQGTTYDFIEKKVVPRYEYSTKEISLGTRTVVSAADGTFRVAVADTFPGDAYRIVLTSVDPEGRKIMASVDATPPVARANAGLQAYLEVPGGCGAPSVQARLDRPVSLTMRQGDGSVAPAGHFLFIVSVPGSLETTVQDAATFTRTLRDADLPGFSARAVWLSATGYHVADVRVDVDPRDKTLKIQLKPDRASYQPGDQVSMGVTTTGPDGHPASADVVIQGVDQKLFAIGAAFDSDPLESLLSPNGPGFGGSYVSHAVPAPGLEGCGDTGGERDDFRDLVTFQRIKTDASGHGSITFKLSDDLTSWHMTATAVSTALDAGTGFVLIRVGLPFFVDAIVAPEYLAGDTPIMRLRAYGSGLANGDHVRFVVSAPSLGLAPTTIEGTAFESLQLPLPTMVVGDHAIRVEASATHAGAARNDVLIRNVHVIDTRLGTVAASYGALTADFQPQGGAGLTTYVVTDAGRGRFIGLLEELASSQSARFDRTAAAELARQLLIQEFEVPAGSLETTGFDESRYMHDGVALLPYASGDLFLSSRAALVAASMVDVESLRGYLESQLDAESATRERRIVALAGLAGLGDGVLEQLGTYDPATLTLREQLWLAIGYAAAGDEASARSIERTVLEASGQRLGPWIRIAAGTTLDDSLEASGLLLMLAARLGDPIAPDVSRYLLDHPSNEQVFPLEQIAYVQGMLDRTPKTAGRFAWTVADERHEVALEPGGAFSLVLTAGQRASLRLEPLAGQLGIAATWVASGGVLPSDQTISVTRTVTPSGDAPDDRLIKVTLAVTFGAQAPGGCYRLTDLLPSGLAPVVAGAGWPDEGGDDPRGGLVYRPYDIEGQRVSWCVSPQDANHLYGYSARVVTAGTYRWEPAVVQSEVAPTVGSSTLATTYTIR